MVTHKLIEVWILIMTLGIFWTGNEENIIKSTYSFNFFEPNFANSYEQNMISLNLYELYYKV